MTLNTLKGLQENQKNSLFSVSLHEHAGVSVSEIPDIPYLCDGIDWDYVNGSHQIFLSLIETEQATIGNLVKRLITKHPSLTIVYTQYNRVGEVTFKTAFDHVMLEKSSTSSSWVEVAAGEVKRYNLRLSAGSVR